MVQFEFLESYRKLAPETEREIVSAREQAHTALLKELKSTARILDLSRLAFQSNFQRAEVVDWFQKAVRKTDPQFSLEQDRAEAARIASLLLRSRIADDDVKPAVAVLVASVGGRRQCIDRQLLEDAMAALVRSAKARRKLTSTSIKYPGVGDIQAELARLTENTPDAQKVAITAAFDDVHDSGTKLADLVQAALGGMQSDIRRLAEELDMLWWHVGGWSELLDKPWSALAGESVCIVAGIDLAVLVRTLPGPYGAQGILSRTLSDGDKENDLTSAVDGLTKEQASALVAAVPDGFADLFPVHSAIMLKAESNGSGWKTTFTTQTGLPKALKLSGLRAATQAYFERLLMVAG